MKCLLTHPLVPTPPFTFDKLSTRVASCQHGAVDTVMQMPCHSDNTYTSCFCPEGWLPQPGRRSRDGKHMVKDTQTSPPNVQTMPLFMHMHDGRTNPLPTTLLLPRGVALPEHAAKSGAQIQLPQHAMLARRIGAAARPPFSNPTLLPLTISFVDASPVLRRPWLDPPPKAFFQEPDMHTGVHGGCLSACLLRRPFTQELTRTQICRHSNTQTLTYSW